MTRRFPALLFAGLIVVLPVFAADPPATEPIPAGTWKLLLPGVRESEGGPVWLIKVEKKDGSWAGSVLATAERWPKGEIQKLTVEKDSLRLTIKAAEMTLPCEFRLTKTGDKLYGGATLRSNHTPVELERTSVTSLDPFELIKEEVARKPLGFDVVGMALMLLQQAEEKKAKPAEVRSWAEKAVKSAELYGPGWQRHIIVAVGEILSNRKGYEAIGLQYAQRAERMLEAKEHPAAQERVLSVLAEALEKNGKKEEAQAVRGRLAKLDFSIKTRAYPGRKNKSDRVVLVEMFTGAESEVCVATDLALEAVARTFKPTEVAILRYHLHAPKPDPLASEENELRTRFYEDSLRSLPALYLNGKPSIPGGGTRSDAQDKYEDYVDAISPLLEKPSQAEISLQATQKDGKVNITAEVKNAAETGNDVRLRLVLVEEEVKYKGSNGLTVHQNVVRSLPGGEAGIPLADKAAKATVTVDLEELRKKRKEYLTEYGKKRPFTSKEQPLELKKLRVVALVQNDKSGEVLQAAQTEVKEAGAGK